MARNLYARPEELREFVGLDTVGSWPVGRVETLVERVSRGVDRWCGRRFYSEVGTAEYDGNGCSRLNLELASVEPFRGDLISVTTLKVDETGDGTFELTLSEGTDYWLEPDNPSTRHRPATHLLIPTGRTTSPQIWVWPHARRRIQLAGKFGWSEETESTGLTGTLANETSTTLTATTDAGAAVRVGDTIVQESEQMYVTAVAGAVITVARGVNGTTAAAHAAKAISRIVYPADVVEAVMLESARQYRELATGYGGAVASLSEGGYSSFRATAPAIKELLGPYRRMVAA